MFDKRIVFLLSFLFFSLQLAGQLAKCNADLYAYWQAQPNSNEELHGIVEIEGWPSALKSLENEGLRRKYSTKNLHALAFPLALLPELLSLPQVRRLEVSFDRAQSLQSPPPDSALYLNNRFLPVHEGLAPLPQALRGEGVLLGIIDDGFELYHPDFLRPQDSSSRVAWLWDQNLTSSPQTPYGYGIFYLGSDIDTRNCFHIPKPHGTHVAAIALGNGFAAGGRFMGLAPDADALLVSCQQGAAFRAAFVDGLHALFNKAEELGKPIVVNSSLGSYAGSHDARDLHARMVEALLDEAPGRALVQAAGNARQEPFHWTNAGWPEARIAFVPLSQVPGLSRWTCYADTGSFAQLRLGLRLLDANTGQELLQSRQYSFPQDFQLLPWGLWQLKDSLPLFGQSSPIHIQMLLSPYDGGEELRIDAHAAPGQYWEFSCEGSARLDLWSAPNLTGSSALVFLPLPHYKEPDNEQTIVSSWPCSEQVITVAAYQNLDYIDSYNGATMPLGTQGYPVPGIAQFSSLGPTRDGRPKPDITASGGQVIAAAPIYELNMFRNNGHPFLDSAGWHVSNRGTSMAAPIVAGALALYLQCRPDATWQELKEALAGSAYSDSLSLLQGSLPNIHWGAGKLDAFALCQACIRPGCTDSLAFNYDAQANSNDGSCFYLPSSSQAQNKPNPQLFVSLQEGEQSLHYKDMPTGNYQLQLYDALGRELWQEQVQLNYSEGRLLLPTKQGSGIFFWQLLGQGQQYSGSY